jgi:hypothetical protein
MLRARPAKEVVLRLPNEIGALNGIAKTLADKGVNVLAVSAWVEGELANVRLLTDEATRVADALKGQNYSVREADVVVTDVPHKPGMLRHITETLAHDGIDIHHLYASTTPTVDRCFVVFATANNDRAIVRLNTDRH